MQDLNSENSEKIRACIYDIQLPEERHGEIVKRVAECESLVQTYGGKVIHKTIQRRHHAATRTFIGHHKLESLVALACEEKANLIILNRELKPGQIYNIEFYLEKNKLQKQIRIWDRLDLIIAIFSRHAKSSEAKLQLELAKIEHFGPRIYGMGDELSQQSAGIGTRGIGETNTEIMKRHIAKRKKLLRKKIEKLQSIKKANRDRRLKMGFKTVSIIGYTNAGKSQLFQSLTNKNNVVVRNELFATLDTKIAHLFLPNTKPSQTVVLCDTIGFIRDLPTNLIDSFHSTLEETIKSDLLLHVVDISENDFSAKIKEVEKVLKILGCDHVPRFFIFNKIDKLSSEDFIKSFQASKMLGGYNYVFVSAKTGENIVQLRERITFWFFGGQVKKSQKTPSSLLRENYENH